MALLVVIIVAVVAWGLFAFNRLVRLRNQVNTAWADIDVQLKRRHELVPRLVESVKGYMGYERGVLTSITDLRSQAMALRNPAQLAPVEGELEKSIGQIFALKEAYPDLKANQNLLQLQRDLVGVEDNLQYARRFYNGAVRDYNTAIQNFPGVLIANAGGFSPREFFHADDEDRAQVNVDLSK
jgi:LemA protein